jgi:hypothetical protein
MATLSSTSLEESKPALRRNASISSSSPLFPNLNENNENMKIKQQQQSAIDNQPSRSNANEKLISTEISEKIEYELVDNPKSKSHISPESLLSSSSSVTSLNSSTSNTSTLLSYLQYGDVFIRLYPLV